MKVAFASFIGLLVLGSSAFALATDTPKLECFTGPILEEVGGTEWQVTSCNDSKSLVFATTKDNPAMPFIFIRQYKDGSYSISGEGNGDKKFTKLAFDDLKSRSGEDFSNLIKRTKVADSRKREEKK